MSISTITKARPPYLIPFSANLNHLKIIIRTKSYSNGCVSTLWDQVLSIPRQDLVTFFPKQSPSFYLNWELVFCSLMVNSFQYKCRQGVDWSIHSNSCEIFVNSQKGQFDKEMAAVWVWSLGQVLPTHGRTLRRTSRWSRLCLWRTSDYQWARPGSWNSLEGSD